jgi:hypothetical protein
MSDRKITGEDERGVIDLYVKAKVENGQSKIPQNCNPGSYYLCLGHLLGVILYLVILGLDFLGITGLCWSGLEGVSDRVCKFSEQVYIHIGLSIPISFPLLGSLYLRGYNRRKEVLTWADGLTLVLASMFATTILTVLMIQILFRYFTS